MPQEREMRRKVHTMRLFTIEELLPHVIIGAEDPEGGSGEPNGDGEGENGGDNDGEAGESGAGEPSGNQPKSDGNIDGLKSALEKERQQNRAREKELKKFRKAQEEAELAKKTEVEQAQERLRLADERSAKLAAGFLRSSLNQSIRDAAQKQGFIDPDDAISGVDRDSITAEQDEDDPSDITIDAKSVEKAVKALATKKPHFVSSGTNDGEPSGSQFGGSKKKTTQTAEDKLKERYPSLR